MIKSLLYDLYLCIRRLFLYVLGIVILLGIFIYSVVNSPWVIKKVAQKFAPDYNITYSRIYGNIVTGVEIDDLRYNSEPLVEHMKLKWNPNGLARKEIIINNLMVKKVNVDNIIKMVNAFSQEPSSEPTSTFDFTIYVAKSTITLAPFKQSDLFIEDVSLEVSDVYYHDEVVGAKHLELYIDTNISKAYYKGSVIKNATTGTLTLSLKETLFVQYDLPLRYDALQTLNIEIDASKERVIAKLDTQVEQLLTEDNSSFNLDINSLHTTANYMLESKKLKVNTNAIISMPYAKNIVVKNVFIMDEDITYIGEVYIKKLIGIEAKLVKPLHNLIINYEGTDKGIKTKIDSSMIQGSFVSKDFKTALLHLESKEALLLREYVELPLELSQSKVNIELDLPLIFESNASHRASIKVNSNVVNLDVNVSYTDVLHVKSKIIIPKKSLLKAYSQDLKWDKLQQIYVNATLNEQGVDVALNVHTLAMNAIYELNSTYVKGNIHIGSLDASISGVLNEQLKLDTHIKSISSLLTTVSEVYTLEDMPNVEGSVEVSVALNKLKSVDVQMQSPKIQYYSDRKTIHTLEDISLVVYANESNVTLKNYSVRYAKNKIFATKPSQVTLKDDLILLSPLWVNDALKTEGSYDLKTQKGKIVTKAKRLQLNHEIIDLDTQIDMTTLLDGNKTSVKGKVIILGGNIHYDLDQNNFASDSDILIVQEMTADEPSVFMENLSAEVQVSTTKPLVYKKGPIAIKLKVDVGVHKNEHAPLLVLGTVEVLKGGSYVFQNKKFTLEQSFIHFAGDPYKPILDMKVKYKALNYVVTIGITGSAELPNIQFSSKPSLNKEQILSLILFDTVEGAGTNSGDDMMKMMGGAMAKSALNDLGVKIDHLVLGEGNSVEVGKKLTNNITIIYVNDIVSGVKLKYEHSKHRESVISADEESQSYDIVYKRDF